MDVLQSSGFALEHLGGGIWGHGWRPKCTWRAEYPVDAILEVDKDYPIHASFFGEGRLVACARHTSKLLGERK